MIPSPQMPEHALRIPAEVVHVQFGSIVQVEEQPSPSVVFPSSHPSAPRRRPSPQIAVQTLGEPEQVHPGSTLQLRLQPSPATAFPSLQACEDGGEQKPAQHEAPLGHLIAPPQPRGLQAPCTHAPPAGQAFPHAPQFCGSS